MDQKKINKWKRYTYIYIIVLLLALVIHEAAFHNIDLMHNYALIYNDINADLNEAAIKGFLNVRNIRDCTGFRYCPNHDTIYLTSMVMLKVSHFLMLGIILHYGISSYFRLKKKTKKNDTLAKR